MYSKCDAPTITNISCMHFICFGSIITFMFCRYVLYLLVNPCLRLDSYLMHSFTVADWLYGLQEKFCLFFGMKQTWSINQSIIIIKQEGVKNHIVPESSRSLQQKFHRIPTWLEAKFFFIFLKQSIILIHWLKIFTMHTTMCLIYQYSLMKTQVSLRIHCVFFSISVDIMIGFSLHSQS